MVRIWFGFGLANQKWSGNDWLASASPTLIHDLALMKPLQTDQLGFGAQGRYDLNQDVLHNRITFRYGESTVERDEDLCRSN